MVKPQDVSSPTQEQGARLMKARKSLIPKKTQADLGEILGVRNTAISKWESGAVPMDDRSLMSLEFTLGINPAYIKDGSEPMLLPSWNREAMRTRLDDLAGAPIHGVWTIPAGHGMAPTFQTGDLAMITKTETLIQGGIFLIAPKGAQWETEGIAPRSSQIGQAFRIETPTGESWLLYRLEDRMSPGSYHPLPLQNMQVIGRVVSVTKPIALPVTTSATTV